MVIMDNVTYEDTLLDIETAERTDFMTARWYAILCTQRSGVSVPILHKCWGAQRDMGDIYAMNATWALCSGRRFSELCNMSPDQRLALEFRFLTYLDDEDYMYHIYDYKLGFEWVLRQEQIRNPRFNIVTWLERQIAACYREEYEYLDLDYMGVSSLFESEEAEGAYTDSDTFYVDGESDDLSDNESIAGSNINCTTLQQMLKQQESDVEFVNEQHMILFAAQPAANKPSVLPVLQRNAAVTKDPSRIVPNPVTVVVNIDGSPARALIDTGSLCDFMSSTLADQLRLKREELKTALVVQLAVLGSRSKVNYKVNAQFEYQGINERRAFDIINLSSYDLILGTPFLFQHKVMIGLNDTRIIIGSNIAMPIRGASVTSLSSRTAQLRAENLEGARKYLITLAKPLCKTAAETGLPPMRAINHRIELLDENKVYPWRPARCPEAFMAQWVEKRNAYIATDRWEMTNTRNAVPMMYIAKPGKDGEPAKLRTVIDLHARNDNMKKMASPLPDIDGIMRRVASKKYRSLLDLKDAYEQVRIEPDDIWKTAFAMPNGKMVSHVLQQGDANAPATYQTLMNYIFSPYIGKFLDVYLDDIVIYSDSLEDHIKHVMLVLQILTKEQFYLSESKLNFLCNKVKILGRVVDDEGIQMDPHKVDALIK